VLGQVVNFDDRHKADDNGVEADFNVWPHGTANEQTRVS